jgi:hypothetical protein
VKVVFYSKARGASLAREWPSPHGWWQSTDIQVVHMEPRGQAVTAAIGSRFSHFPTQYLILIGA